MRKINLFSEISILGLVFELILISFIFFSLGYISNRADPLLINSQINVLLILVSVVTLFYGLFSGILVMAATAIGLYHFYKPFPYNYFVNNLLFMLIFSEFHYFWNRTLKKLYKQNEYTQARMDELSRNFYTLKLSHDQLEKSYILKPNSLRNILTQIKNIYFQNPSGAYEELLTVVAKNYGIKKAAIFSFRKGVFEKAAAYSMETSLNEESRVFKDALETKSPSYLSNFQDIKKDYLAVLPAYDSSENLNFVMAIEDMQFLQFNKDTIFSIWVILNYFSDFVSAADYAEDIIAAYPHCPADFLVEIKRLAYIRKKLDLKSLLLIVKVKKAGVGIEDINSFISKSLRGMDMTCFKGDMLFIMFPLVSYSNIQPVIEKIETQTSQRFALSPGDFSYKVFEVMSDPKKTADYILAIIEKENESR